MAATTVTPIVHNKIELVSLPKTLRYALIFDLQVLGR